MLCYNSCLSHLQHNGVVNNVVFSCFSGHCKVSHVYSCVPMQIMCSTIIYRYVLCAVYAFILLFVLMYWPCCGRCCIWESDCLELISAGNEGVPAPSNLRPVASLELDDLHGELQCPSGKWCNDNEWLLPMHNRPQLETQQCQITRTIKNRTR
jgi:hypothetical protein